MEKVDQERKHLSVTSCRGDMYNFIARHWFICFPVQQPEITARSACVDNPFQVPQSPIGLGP